MKEFKFIIDGQPMSKKRNWTIIWPKYGTRRAERDTRGPAPRIVLKKQYKDWEKSATDQLWAQRMTYQSHMTGILTITSYVEVAFEFFLKDKRRYDLSNLIQGPEDALVKAGILEDDSLIQSVDRSRKHPGCENPRVEITIRSFMC